MIYFDRLFNTIRHEILKVWPWSGYNLEYYIVAWLDLLGQSQKLEQLYISHDASEREKILKIAKGTFGHLDLFRRGSSNMHKEMAKALRYSKPIKEDLTRDQMQILNKYNWARITSKFFADSHILYIRLQGLGYQVPIMSIESMLHQIAGNMLIFLSLGIPIRGAIAIGICDETKMGTLYGQGLSRAHRCEARAGYPRIVVHPEFLVYLNSIDYSIFSEDERKYCTRMVTQIKKVLIKDYDGKLIFSYLAPKYMQVHYKTEDGKKILIKACNFISREIQRFSDIGAKGSELRDRYMKLKDYFESQAQWVI